MRKFTFSFKSLLLAAGLLMGSASAWADEIVLNSTQSAYVDQANSTTNYNGASVENLQIYSTQFRDWNSGSDGSVKFNSDGKVALYKFDLTSIKSIGTITAVTFTVKGQTNSGDGKSTGYVRVLGYTPTWDASTITHSTLTNNGNSETLTGTVSGKGSFQPLNTTSNQTINATETTLDINAITYVQSAIDADKDYVTIALVNNLTRGAALETGAKLTVTYTTASTYNVTFSETNSVSATIKIDDTDVTSGTVLEDGDYSFTATATGYYNYNGNFTVDGADLNVEFTMTAKPTYSYTVYAKSGETTLKTIKSGTDYKDDNVYYHYNQVLNYNGTLYTAASISSGYKTSFVLDSNGKEVDHSYSQPATPITNLVFLAEGEDIFTIGTGSAADTRCSMGAGGYATSKTDFVTLPAGEYYLVLSNRCSGGRTGIHNFYKGDDEDPFFSADGNGYNAERKSGLFTLTKPTTLYFQGGNSNEYVDWLYIYGTPASEVKTSSANLRGYKTFYDEDNNYQVDANTTIYKASASKTEVTLTSVEGNIVPKNTPVILKTTNTSDYTMILTATLDEPASGAYDGNALQVSDGTESNVFILAYTTAQGFGFYKYTSTLDAGDIYLAIPSEAKMLRVVVDGTASEVIAPEVADVEEEEVLYNMAGVQVDKNFKGFVVNQKGEKRFNK